MASVPCQEDADELQLTRSLRSREQLEVRDRGGPELAAVEFQADERTTDKLAERVPFPESAARALAFDLAIPGKASTFAAMISFC